MKKVLLLAVIFGGSLAFTSCSSETDFTCVCTKTYTTSGTSPDKNIAVLRGIDEDAASSTCTSLADTGTGFTETCTLVD